MGQLTRNPDQLVGGGFDDDQFAVDDEQAGGLGELGGKRAYLVGLRVVPADRPVVGVRDPDRSVGQHGHPERVLQPRLRRRPVDVSEVEQPCSDHGVQPAIGGEVAQGRRLGVGKP